MANLTKSARHNRDMDRIFAYHKEHSVPSKNGKTSYDTRYWRETKKGEIVKRMKDYGSHPSK